MTHNPVFITDERSSCFNFLCCVLTASFPHPHPFPPPRPFPVPSPLPPFLSFTVYFGETTPLPDQSCCSFLDNCSYFPSPCERSRNDSVFACSSIAVYLFVMPAASRTFMPLPCSMICVSNALFFLSSRVPPFLLIFCLVIGFLPPCLQFFTIPTQLATTTPSYRSRTPTHNGYRHAFSI